jgi:hypothetical protein
VYSTLIFSGDSGVLGTFLRLYDWISESEHLNKISFAMPSGCK